MFADWDMMRDEKLPGHGWLELLRVFGCVTLAAFLAGLAFVYCNAFLQNAFDPLLFFLIYIYSWKSTS